MFSFIKQFFAKTAKVYSPIEESNKRFLGKNTDLAPSMKVFHLLVSYCFQARSAQNTARYLQCSNCYKNKISEYNRILTTFL